MSPPRSTTRKIFHYIYNTVYVVLCFVLAALILVTPGDAIRQTYYKTLQYTNIVIIAIAYLVTVLIVLFIYSLRLYVTRTVLASIPKSWVPLNKGEIKKNVREMIHKELARSAAIAWQARPKVSSASFMDYADDLSAVAEDEEDSDRNGNGPEYQKDERPTPNRRLKTSETAEEEMGIALPPTKPVWGHIDHPGWGSPESPDLTNIQYSTVLAELPNLIEAKAMSLAPTLPDSSDEVPLLDPEAVEALQRLGNMSMRTYVGHLVDLGVLEASNDTAEFLDVYERARFSTKPISGDMFRRLMHLFAELLRSAKSLDRGVLETMRSMNEMYTESDAGSSLDEQSFYFAQSRHRADIDDDAPQHTSPTTPARSMRSLDSDSSPKTRDNVRPALVGRTSSGAHSKPSRSRTVSSRKQLARTTSNMSSVRSGSSGDSFAQSRRPYLAGSLSSSSRGDSLRSGSRGSDGGSVIRLATRDDGGDLPYILRVTTTI